MSADEQMISIDIHSNRLLEWLLNRRHCSKDWQKKVMVVREKISAAIQDMPEDERVMELLQGSYINYFHCIKIVEILKETEKDTKNFLGYYSSQRMNDWLQIKKLYENENLYLAEAAQLLQRMVQYEIPSLKREIAKCDQTINECARKQKEYGKQSVDAKKQYEKELAKMGIKGQQLRSELLSLLSDLPAFLDEVLVKVRELKPALKYYEDFRAYLMQNNDTRSNLLQTCNMLIKEGNITAYELKFGSAPKSIELASLNAFVGEKANEFCDEIDFGDNVSDLKSPSDETDFSDSEIIEVIGDEQGYLDDGIARGLDALTLLENPDTQRIIKYELMELQTFLIMRREDESLESPADIYIAGLEERPGELKKITLSQIGRWSSAVGGVLSDLNSPQKAHLFKLRSHPEYVEKLVEMLEKKASLEGRFKRMEELMLEKQDEMRSKAVQLQVNLNKIFSATKILQKEIEEDISRRYSGRKVNIMGGINAALVSA